MKTIYTLIFLLLGSFVQAQYIQIGNAQYQGTYRFGPMAAESAQSGYFGRFAYIYPSASLGNLQHGDTIRSISFRRQGFDSLRGTVNFKIYMGMTQQADFGAGSINWKDETEVRIGIFKVYEGDPTNATGNQPDWVRYDFDDTNYYVVDTTNGKNHLEILTEYTQNTNQASNINWNYDTDFSFPYYFSNNETKYVFGTGAVQDSLINSSIAKPAVRLHVPKFKREAGLSMLYALGRNPLLMGKADSIKTFIENTGLETIYQQELYLEISGANSFNDTLVLDSLLPHEKILVAFNSFIPQFLGRNTLNISIPDDGVLNNNLVTAVQDVTYNVYSHADPVTTNAGGIGFNGSSGDFVARFETDSAKFLNQVKVDFAQGGRPFQIGIWEAASNGQPGRNIFTSDTLTSVAGTYILRVDPKVLVDGVFFVGLRQTGTINIAFAFQEESPVRPNTFYFAAPLGDTDWVSFSPGFDFKFNIQPRLEVDHDVAPVRIAFPRNDTTFVYNFLDSIDVRAVIYNYGSENQDTAFDVACEIRSEFGQISAREVQRVTLDSEDSVLVQFRKIFSLNNKGAFTARVYTELWKDLVPDNDELSSNFRVEIPVDLAITRYFVPSSNIDYELNVDSIEPVLRLENYGATDLRNFWVQLQFTQDSSLVYTDSLLIPLLRRDDSQIISFRSYFCNRLGDFMSRAAISIVGDIFPSNDTLFMPFRVVKSNDVRVDSLLFPSDQSLVGTSYGLRPSALIRNDGLLDQDSIDVFGMIYLADSLIWQDSIQVSLVGGGLGIADFSTFVTANLIGQQYVFRVRTDIFNDQDRSNDTLSGSFGLMASNDLAVTKIVRPGNRIPLNSPDSVFRFEISNKGFLSYIRNAEYLTKIYQNGTLFWADSFTFNPFLAPEESIQLGTSKGFKANTSGDYNGLVVVRSNNDEWSANDSLHFTFYVSADNDLSLSFGKTPLDTLLCNQAFAPEFLIRNLGMSPYPSDSAVIDVDIKTDGTSIHAETHRIAEELLPNQSYLWALNELRLCDTGWYDLRADLHPDDDNAENQVLEHRFYVYKPYDMVADSILLPLNGTRYQSGSKIAIFPSARWLNAGSVDAENIMLVCALYGGGATLMRDTLLRNFVSGGTEIVVFESVLPLDVEGDFELWFYHVYEQDLIKDNDTLKTRFSVANLSSIDAPNQQIFVLVYPNPMQNRVTIQRGGGEKQLIEMSWISANGIVLMKDQLKAEEQMKFVELPNNWASGVYTLQLRTENGLFKVVQLIKE